MMNNKEKIKIFVDAHVFDGIHQGTVTFIAGLYAEIAKDDRFELYVGSEDYGRTAELLKSNHFNHIKYKRQSNILRLLYTIPYELKKHKIEYAHFQYISPIFKSCKYIVTVHDLLFIEHKSYFPTAFRLRNTLLFYISSLSADILTTVSDYSKKSIQRYFKIPAAAISITPNAVNVYTDKTEPIVELIDSKFILFVSRIEFRKNQTKLIKIWKELELYNQGYKLILVGGMGIPDLNFEKELQHLTAEQQENFRWLKGISNAELFWLYKNCSLFVFPSIAEGFGIPPLEAALQGAKVLCSNKTAMSEFDFFGDFHFNPNNDDEFRNRLIQSISMPFPTNEVTESIKQKYNWLQIKKNFVDTILQNKEK